MKTNVNFYAFCDAFSDTYKNYFTYEGKRALFDYIIEFENDIGEEIELDIVTFCWEYSEYENLAELNEDRIAKYKTIDELKNDTQVIEFGNGQIIIQEF